MKMSFVVCCYDSETGHVEIVSNEYIETDPEAKPDMVEMFARNDTGTANVYFAKDVIE